MGTRAIRVESAAASRPGRSGNARGDAIPHRHGGRAARARAGDRFTRGQAAGPRGVRRRREIQGGCAELARAAVDRQPGARRPSRDPDARQVSGADDRRRLRDGGCHRRGRDGLRSHHGSPRPRAPVRAGRPRRLPPVRDLDPGEPRAQGPARLRRLARGDQVGGAVGRIPQRPAQPGIGAAAPRADRGCGDHGVGLHRRAHAAPGRPVPAAR